MDDTQNAGIDGATASALSTPKLTIVSATSALLLTSLLLALASSLSALAPYPYALNASAPVLFGSISVALLIGAGVAIALRNSVGTPMIAITSAVLSVIAVVIVNGNPQWGLAGLFLLVLLSGLAFLSGALRALEASALNSLIGMFLPLIIAAAAFTVIAPIAAKSNALALCSVATSALSVVTAAFTLRVRHRAVQDG